VAAPASAQLDPLLDPLTTWIPIDLVNEGTWINFGSPPGGVPIPADFFDPGSEPFTGQVILRGQPLGNPDAGDADTIVRRGFDPFLPSDPPGGPPVMVPIEIVALELTSCQPITVTYGGSNPPTEQWQVHVELSPQEPSDPPQIGQMTVRKTHPNGGTFDAFFPIQPLLVFTRVDDGTQRILDTEVQGMPPLPFLVENVPWVNQADPELELLDQPGKIFYPGVEEVPGVGQRVVAFSPIAPPPPNPPLVLHTVCQPVKKKLVCIYDIVCVQGDCSSCPAAVAGKCRTSSCPSKTCGVLAGQTSSCGINGCCIEFGQFDCRPPAGEPPCPTPDVDCVCDPPVEGACCLPSGACVQTLPTACPGTFMGGPCQTPQPCCLPGGICVDLEPRCCMDQGGVVQPVGTQCTQPEACCITGAAGVICVDVDPLCCDEMGGTPQGAGTACAGTDLNGNGIDDACDPDPAGYCPLGSPLCASLQATDCPLITPAQTACMPTVLTLDAQGLIVAAECSCLEQDFECGLIEFDGQTISCPGLCPDPNDICQVWIQDPGQIVYNPTGQQSILASQIQSGANVKCDCGLPPVTDCVPNPGGTACEPFACPVPPVGQVCIAECIRFDAWSGKQTITNCDCQATTDCHAEFGPAPVGPRCVGDCPPGQICVETITQVIPGVFDVCCDCVPDVTDCKPNTAGTACEPFTCPDPSQTCKPTLISVDPLTLAVTVLQCDCVDKCYVDFLPAVGAFCVNPVCDIPGEICVPFAVDTDGDGVDDRFWCDCRQDSNCDPDTSSPTGCSATNCQLPGEECLPKCLEYDPADPFGTQQVADCDCRSQFECHPEIIQGTIPDCVGGCPAPLQCVKTVTNDPVTGLDTICCDCVATTGACCIDVPPAGPTCIITTAGDCANQGGVYAGDGTSCGVIDACCLPDGTCQMLYTTCCQLAGGQVESGQTCQGTSACCLANGDCVPADGLCCDLELGGVPVAGAVCSQELKCCLPDGTCDFMDPACCAARGGVSSSSPPPCDQQGCCMPDGSCIDTDPECCVQFGGTVQPTLCQPDEACCITPSAANPLGCLNTSPQCCLAAGGTPQGAGSACSGLDADGDGLDDACKACQMACGDCDDNDPCTCGRCANGFCQFLQKKYGDVDCNGFIGLADLFCVLDGFGGDFSTCCFEDDDIAPCAGNGSIGLADLFAVLDAFGGDNACGCSAGPTPPPVAERQVSGDKAEIRQGSAQRATPAAILVVPQGGSEIKASGATLVDVYAAGAIGLRGYEIKLSAAGGSRGEIEIENVSVDVSRKDYVFLGRNGYTATDQAGGRIAGLLWDGSLPSAGQVYLGTFAVRPTREARGDFTLSVNVGQGTVLVDSNEREITVRRPAPVVVTVR